MPRIYISSTGTPAISPTPDAAWDDSATLLTFFRRTASLTKTNSALASTTKVLQNAANKNAIYLQAILPLASGIKFRTTDTINGQFLAVESGTGSPANQDSRAQMGFRIVDSSGTIVRATLRALDSAALSSEFATSLTNRAFPLLALQPVSLAANYTTVSGDCAVFEIGGRHALGNTNWNIGISHGDPTGSTDLPVNETDTTTTKCGWIDLSTSFIPIASGGSAYFLM